MSTVLLDLLGYIYNVRSWDGRDLIIHIYIDSFVGNEAIIWLYLSTVTNFIQGI